MANLTIAVDEEVLRRARVRAVEEGTSVNAILRHHLEEYAEQQRTASRATARFLQIARASGASSQGETFTREELHDREGLR